MATRAAIHGFLTLRRIAVVGVSRNPKDFNNAVYRRLRDAGYTVYPVNDSADWVAIEGDPSYPNVADIPEPVDGVLVMVPRSHAADVVRDAIGRGVRHVWLHRGVGRGSVSDEAVALCRFQGVDVVEGACPLMFLPPVQGIHRIHRLLVGRRVASAVST